jgi:hypothetical protein
MHPKDISLLDMCIRRIHPLIEEEFVSEWNEDFIFVVLFILAVKQSGLDDLLDDEQEGETCPAYSNRCQFIPELTMAKIDTDSIANLKVLEISMFLYLLKHNLFICSINDYKTYYSEDTTID